jgi:hypothetical protein
MTRDELIAVAIDAAQNTPWTQRPTFDEDDEANVVAAVNAVEPLIRADEREKVKAEYVPVLMEHLRILADLRARVEALRPGVRWDPYQGGNPDVVLRADVLALLDGATR